MTEFLYALDDRATAQQRAIVEGGLAARFPELKFTAAQAMPALENTIIPLVGRPDATPKGDDDQDGRTIIEFPPDDLVSEVREAFCGLVLEAKAARPS